MLFLAIIGLGAVAASILGLYYSFKALFDLVHAAKLPWLRIAVITAVAFTSIAGLLGGSVVAAVGIYAATHGRLPG